MSPWFHAFSWRWRARRFRRAPRLPAILLYHSVSQRTRDPLHLAIRPDVFVSHLEWLGRHTTPLPLAEFVQRHRNGTLPVNAVALTFDDGYADNLTAAEPLLRHSGIPATVFVVTDYIDSPLEGWWDELDAIFLETPRLPERFQFGLFVCGTEPRIDPARVSWTVLDPPVTLRERAFLAASAWGRGLRREERECFLVALRDWSQRAPAVRPGRGFAQWSKLREAHRGGVLTVGAHTRSHPALALLPAGEQRMEIGESCDAVRAQLQTEPAGFAYPFGTYHDFSSVTRALARECRTAFACANMAASLTRGANPWELPRVLVWDWDVQELAARLGA